MDQNQSISICNTGRLYLSLSLSLALRRCIGNENRKKTAKPKIGARTDTLRECTFMSDPWGLVSLNLYYWRLRLFLIPFSLGLSTPGVENKIDIYFEVKKLEKDSMF